eukprot:3268557-Pyramimonas_sp.AAC.1
MASARKLLRALRGEGVDWDEWEAELMPRGQCERCRRRLLVEALPKYEFQRKERPTFCEACAGDEERRREMVHNVQRVGNESEG